MKSVNKLVRDNILDKIHSKGEKCEHYIADRVQHVSSIIDKLFEESEEIKSAENNEKMQEEIGDLLDVIEGLCELKGFSLDEINKLRKTKSKKLGKFKKGIILTKC